MLRRIAATACVLGCLVGGNAAAEQSTAKQRLVVFPLQGVNMPETTARAATELIVSSLRDRRVDVAEHETEAISPAQTPIVAPAAQTLPVQAPVQAASPPILVDHAVPPAYPGMASFSFEGAASAPAPETPALTVKEKSEIARGLGCTGYIDGELVRLGSEIRLSISKRNLDGGETSMRAVSVRTDDSLVGAIDTITRALLGDPAANAALERGLAKKPGAKKKARAEANFGVVIGGMFGVADTMDIGMMVGFDGRFEIDHLLVVANAGLAIASPDKYDEYAVGSGQYDYDTGYTTEDGYTPTDGYDLDGDPPGMQLWVNLDVDGYLSNGAIAPYLGAGIGAFVGGRVHAEKRVDLDGNTENGDDATEYWDSNIGLDVHPTFGFEFLRRSPIRLHLEARYTCNFSSGGEFGHGPVVLAGVNF